MTDDVGTTQQRATLITGGCGFLGRHLACRLLEDGTRALALIDDLSVGQHPDLWLPATSVAQTDSDTWVYETRDGARVCFRREDVRRALRPSEHARWLPWRSPWGDVFHLAARVGGRLTLEALPMDIADNLSIDAAFFRWMASQRPAVLRTLYVSSSAVYPMDHQRFESAVALPESLTDVSPPHATDGMYGWAKLTGEFLVTTLRRQTAAHIACVRPFSVYGPDQDSTYPMSAIGRRAVRREDPLVVWGAGDQQRDLVYIDDAIDALLLALARAGDGQPVNIGSGVGRSFRHVAEAMASAVGYRPTIKIDNEKPTGAEVRVADTTRMEHVLGWRPVIPFEQGIRRLIAALEGDSDGRAVHVAHDPRVA